MGNISSSTDRKAAPASQAGSLSARFKRLFSRSTPSPETRTPTGRRVAVAPAGVALVRAPARQAGSTTSTASTQPRPMAQRRVTSPSMPAQSSSSSRQVSPHRRYLPGELMEDGTEMAPPPPPTPSQPHGPAQSSSTRMPEHGDGPYSLDNSSERTPARPASKARTMTVASRERKYSTGLEMTPSLPSQILSPPQTPAVPASPVPDDTLTPAQAAEWVVATAQEHGGASASDLNLSIFWVEVESHANVWTPSHLQAMGQALGNVFKPSSGIAALAHDLSYAGLERLMRECFLDRQPVLSPVQLGALFGGVRRCLRADLPGADTRFLRIISAAVQAQVPQDHCVAMACGFYRAIQSTARQAYTPSKLTIAVPQSHREAVLETLNWGKRLALEPMSFYNRGVRVMPGKRYPWLMMAYQMPGVPASVQGSPSNGASQLQRAASSMNPAQVREFLTVFKSARALPGVERKGQ